MIVVNWCVRMLPLLGLFTLVACADGASRATGSDSSIVVGAPTLTLGFGIKQLQFSWAAISGVTHYRLLHNPDGASGFTQVGPNLSAVVTRTSLDIAVHKHNWANARYLVEACNSTGCTGSNEVNTLGSVLAAIGYVKASNTGSGDRFGYSVALSSDGKTLAVGAYYEDSAATGVDGNPVDGCATRPKTNCADDSGAVYVYARSAATWSQQAYVKASNTGGGDLFGVAVALSDDGETLAVGAYYEDSAATAGSPVDGCTAIPVTNCATDSGAVYVYTRSGITWSQQAYVKASSTGTGDFFGRSVALSSNGDTLAVGAYYEDSAATSVGGNPVAGCADNPSTNCAANSGAVYVYTRSGITWPQQAYVKASNTGAGDQFGISVALSDDGNTLAVGAFMEDGSKTGSDSTPDLTSDSGAVYVYTRSDITWSQQAYVKAANTEAGDVFGRAVALSGDGNTLAVGAWLEDSGTTGIDSTPNESAADAGAVYVYTRSAATWSQQAYLKASNTGTIDYFGIAVALSGDGNTLAVGARMEDSNATGINSTSNESATDAGAVYTYTRSSATWSQQAYVKASNTGDNDRFGVSVALSGNGDTLAVGAYFEDGAAQDVGGNPNDNSALDAGAVYLY